MTVDPSGPGHSPVVREDVQVSPDDDDIQDDWPLTEEQPPACPACGAPSLPIVYGMPGPELMDLADRGAVILGGCIIEENQPTHQCLAGHPASFSRPGSG